jgi:hypothetical protein
VYRLQDIAEPVFARHETFHPRYGWFGKSVRAAATAHDVFTRDDAPVELGVGKNMVRAIRFWGKAAKVLSDGQNPTRPRVPLTVPSERGVTLLTPPAGLDPYLERPGSLWVLHWWMLSPPCLLPVWWIAFNRFGPIEFSGEDLLDYVTSELRRAAGWTVPVTSSIKKDVDCLLRMYASETKEGMALDDLLDCPFRELGLVEQVWDDRDRYRFVVGQKPALATAVVAYACFDYLGSTDPGASTSTITRLVTSAGSPGKAFKLTEEDLTVALEEYALETGDLKIRSAAGLPQLSFESPAALLASRALRHYYQQADINAAVDLRLGVGPAERDLELWPIGA